MMPTYYYDNCRVTSTSSQWIWCNAQDIAMLKVSKPSGVSYPGAMGWGVWDSAALNSSSRYNRGYPNCSSDGDPVNNCRSNTLYGDRFSCKLGDLLQPDADGWAKLIKHGCDTSPGMSGSPLYRYSSGAKVFGVHRGGNDIGCGFSECTDETPNHVRRITPAWNSQMLSFMGL